MSKLLKYVIRGKDNTGRVFGGVQRRIHKTGRIGKLAFAGMAASAARSGRLIKRTLGSVFTLPRALVAGGLAVGFGAIMKKTFDFESTKTQFEVLLKDVGRARTLLGQLRKESDTTPFTFDEYTNAGRGLLAFGFAAQDVTRTLRNLGNIASGVQMPLGELSEIYGKARVQGRLFMEDINQLTGRGIPIITALANSMGVAESEIRGMVEEGKVGFPELEKAMQSLTEEGGMFEGMMSKMSSTGNGLISTLQGKWSNALVTFGSKFMDLSKGAIQGVIDTLDRLEANGSIEKWAEKGAKAAEALGNMIGKVFGEEDQRGEALRDIGSLLKAGFRDASAAAIEILKKGAPMVGMLIGLAAKASLDQVDKFKKINQYRKEAHQQGEITWMQRNFPNWAGGDNNDIEAAFEARYHREKQAEVQAQAKAAGLTNTPGTSSFMEEWERIMAKYGTQDTEKPAESKPEPPKPKPKSGTGDAALDAFINGDLEDIPDVTGPDPERVKREMARREHQLRITLIKQQGERELQALRAKYARIEAERDKLEGNTQQKQKQDPVVQMRRGMEAIRASMRARAASLGGQMGRERKLNTRLGGQLGGTRETYPKETTGKYINQSLSLGAVMDIKRGQAGRGEKQLGTRSRPMHVRVENLETE